MVRLGVLYPPYGAEFEYYRYGERMGTDVRITLAGVRIFGDGQEHAPAFLRRTAAVGNLEASARQLAPLAPDAIAWACTSGSFIDGLAHARAQQAAVGRAAGCPATSTSLAFLAALQALGITRVSVLASYPDETAGAFAEFLHEAGVITQRLHCLAAGSGPEAAALPESALRAAAEALAVAPEAALLIPDTAIPTLGWIDALEARLGRPVLTANQVTLWELARLAGIVPRQPGLGYLFRVVDPAARDESVP